MPQSLSNVLCHLVFSTKNREPFLDTDVHDDLHAYIGGIAHNLKSNLVKAGSVSDHLHLLVVQPRTISPADLIQEIKAGSSKWLKTRGARYHNFHWQNGYGYFSISPGSHQQALEAYFERQAEHHQDETFQEKYRRILTKYGIEWDERYVWD